MYIDRTRGQNLEQDIWKFNRLEAGLKLLNFRFI